MNDLFGPQPPRPTICPIYRAAAISGLMAHNGPSVYPGDIDGAAEKLLTCHGSTCLWWGGRGCGLVDGMHEIADRMPVG